MIGPIEEVNVSEKGDECHEINSCESCIQRVDNKDKKDSQDDGEDCEQCADWNCNLNQKGHNTVKPLPTSPFREPRGLVNCRLGLFLQGLELEQVFISDLSSQYVIFILIENILNNRKAEVDPNS